MMLDNTKRISLGAGSGGEMTDQLIQEVILPAIWDKKSFPTQEDSALFTVAKKELAFTTDSYIVDPIIFPGGDIGELAVNGSVNDIVMSGAIPYTLSLALILEEGLPVATFKQILNSIGNAARSANVSILCGDTKVAPKGKVDKLFITTSAIGLLRDNIIAPSVSRITENSVVIVNGPIGAHGVAIMSAREGLEFDSTIESDTAPLTSLVDDLYGQNIDILAMRDLTRGGLATVLVEIADASNLTIILDESKIPIENNVASACELLGLDATYVANEGKMVLIVDESDADKTLSIMKKNSLGQSATIVGKVVKKRSSNVFIESLVGGARIVHKLQGEILPRIC